MNTKKQIQDRVEAIQSATETIREEIARFIAEIPEAKDVIRDHDVLTANLRLAKSNGDEIARHLSLANKVLNYD